jgi:predicted HicB family RNase H-like nuclease
MPKRKNALEAAQATVNDAAATAQPASQDSHADGSKDILVRVPSETWRALKVVALEERRSPQTVMVEAVNEYLEKHGKA